MISHWGICLFMGQKGTFCWVFMSHIRLKFIRRPFSFSGGARSQVPLRALFKARTGTWVEPCHFYEYELNFNNFVYYINFARYKYLDGCVSGLPGQLYLRLLKMMIVPLIACSVICGKYYVTYTNIHGVSYEYIYNKNNISKVIVTSKYKASFKHN